MAKKHSQHTWEVDARILALGLRSNPRSLGERSLERTRHLVPASFTSLSPTHAKTRCPCGPHTKTSGWETKLKQLHQQDSSPGPSPARSDPLVHFHWSEKSRRKGDPGSSATCSHTLPLIPLSSKAFTDLLTGLISVFTCIVSSWSSNLSANTCALSREMLELGDVIAANGEWPCSSSWGQFQCPEPRMDEHSKTELGL